MPHEADNNILKITVPEGDSLALHVSWQREEQEVIESIHVLWPFTLRAQGWTCLGNT